MTCNVDSNLLCLLRHRQLESRAIKSSATIFYSHIQQEARPTDRLHLNPFSPRPNPQPNRSYMLHFPLLVNILIIKFAPKFAPNEILRLLFPVAFFLLNLLVLIRHSS
jgi:hypothetical protein